MTLRSRTWVASLFVAALSAAALAQVIHPPVQIQPGRPVQIQPGQPVQIQPGQPVQVQPGQPVQVQPGQGQPGAAMAMSDNQQELQCVIGHALGMAICGSELQIAANAAREGERQNRNEGNANGDNPGEKSGQEWAFGQLQQQATRQFESSQQLFQTADGDLRSGEGNAANRAGDRSAWSRRLYNAANQYANTARTLTAGENWQARTEGGRNERNTKDNLSCAEKAQITLINHAVAEAGWAFALEQGHRTHQFGTQSTAGQQLQTHARQMASDSRQLLQNLMASAKWEREENAGQRENENENPENANAQHGQASVQMLAQRGQQLIDTFQRISGENVPARPGEVPAAGARPATTTPEGTR